jgi:large subunit ribosomal protein L25
MEEIPLEVQLRTQIGSRKIKSIRREDFVPAVVYGGKRGPTTIKVDRRSYEHIMRTHKGQSVVFHLNVMESDKKLRDYFAIVKEEQTGPVSDALVHIDFLRISLTKEIEVKVPVEAKGEAVGVKTEGGSLDHGLWELDIVCLPTNIPKSIEIDISELKIGDAVYVKDIALPMGVKTNHDPESILVSVIPPMKEEAEAAKEGAETEPEVIGEKKESEEGSGEDKPKEKKEENKEKK